MTYRDKLRYKISVIAETEGVGRSSLVNSLIGNEFKEEVTVDSVNGVCFQFI